MNKLDFNRVEQIASNYQWHTIVKDAGQGMISFTKFADGKHVRINVWIRRGSVAIQSGPVSLYKKYCDYQDLSDIFDGRNVKEEDFKKVVQNATSK